MGADAAGAALASHLAQLGVDLTGLRQIPGARTAEYAAALEPDGALRLGLADMAIFDQFSPADAQAALARPCGWIFADCNLPAECLRLLAAPAAARPKLAVDAVSASKVARLPSSGVDLLLLNMQEAAALSGEAMAPAAAARALQARGFPRLVMTLGAAGALIADGQALRLMPAAPADVRDATGAGDALIAATLWRLIAGDDLATAAAVGMRAAALTLASFDSVRADLPQALAGEG